MSVSIKNVRRIKDTPYRYVEELGQGSFGVVISVTHNITGENYARKVMRTHNIPRRVSAFREELRIIERLQGHHHFIRVHEAFETDDGWAGMIISPVADRGSLTDYLNFYLSGPSTFEDSACLKQAFGCLASGLVFMHQHNRIRHKDIKPGNILMDKGKVICECSHSGTVLGTVADQSPTKYIDSDFGLSYDSSEFSDSRSSGPTLTTAKWAAPEVLQSQPRDSSSDVFSLGCVFLEILFTLNSRRVTFDVTNPTYARSMPRLRHELQALSAGSARSRVLAQLILSMTAEHSSRRPDAVIVVNELKEHRHFFCYMCFVASQEPSVDNIITQSVVDLGSAESPRWIWSEAHRNYYYATLDAQGTHTWQRATGYT